MAKIFEYDQSRTKERRTRPDARAQRMQRVSTSVRPIPRRASASSSKAVRVRTRYSRHYTEVTEGDITRLPTIPRSATWQYEEEAEYEGDQGDQGGQEDPDLFLPVEYSPLLSALPSIDELDTLPPQKVRMSSEMDAVVEADTIMDDTLQVVSSSSTDGALYALPVEDVVDVALTVRARALLGRKRSIEDRPAFIHNPLDYMRWWLLSPGRLEFLFWLGGAVVLGVLLCVVLMVTGVGMGWMSFGHVGH
jgi:hypothetical protein